MAVHKIKETLGKVVEDLCIELDEKEKRQDKVLTASREAIRLCARAIRDIHTNDVKLAKKSISDLEEKLKELKSVEKDFEHISKQTYQEYAEIKLFYAISQKQKVPSASELQISIDAYLSGFADCVGELRRALQLALKEGDKEDAEYYFEAMNEIYEELMLLKYSKSLVGSLKPKQDMVRGQLEHARSEILKFTN